MLLIGQSSRGSWSDFVSFGQDPAGGSVYYEVRSNGWNGGDSGIHLDYASFLADRGKTIQVGVSWKDNPPGWSGSGDNGPASRQATLDIADGKYDDRFETLIGFLNDKPRARFLVRIDYEVSSYYHCTDATCDSYKRAFNHVAALIDRRAIHKNASFVYHPVRGEFEKLYPGDAWAHWMGVSIFNHEVCMPIYNMGQVFRNGEGNGDTCRGYILGNVGGNTAAIRHDFDYDFNVLGMMKFAKDHGKPMIVSESAPMNFRAGEGANGTEPDEVVTAWVNRLFGLLSYHGPLPNAAGTYDLSDVIQAVVYINSDLRYGWDGNTGGPYRFRFDEDWYLNAQLSAYSGARGAFCTGLRARGFSTSCGSGAAGSPAPSPPPPPASPATPPASPPAQPSSSVVESNVGRIASGQSWTRTVSVPATGKVRFDITSTSARPSELIAVTFAGVTQVQAVDPGRTIPVYFGEAPAGNHALRIAARSDAVSIGQVIMSRW